MGGSETLAWNPEYLCLISIYTRMFNIIIYTRMFIRGKEGKYRRRSKFERGKLKKSISFDFFDPLLELYNFQMNEGQTHTNVPSTIHTAETFVNQVCWPVRKLKLGQNEGGSKVRNQKIDGRIARNRRVLVPRIPGYRCRRITRNRPMRCEHHLCSSTGPWSRLRMHPPPPRG